MLSVSATIAGSDLFIEILNDGAGADAELLALVENLNDQPTQFFVDINGNRELEDFETRGLIKGLTSINVTGRNLGVPFGNFKWTGDFSGAQVSLTNVSIASVSSATISADFNFPGDVLVADTNQVVFDGQSQFNGLDISNVQTLEDTRNADVTIRQSAEFSNVNSIVLADEPGNRLDIRGDLVVDQSGSDRVTLGSPNSEFLVPRVFVESFSDVDLVITGDSLVSEGTSGGAFNVSTDANLEINTIDAQDISINVSGDLTSNSLIAENSIGTNVDGTADYENIESTIAVLSSFGKTELGLVNTQQLSVSGEGIDLTDEVNVENTIFLNSRTGVDFRNSASIAASQLMLAGEGNFNFDRGVELSANPDESLPGRIAAEIDGRLTLKNEFGLVVDTLDFGTTSIDGLNLAGSSPDSPGILDLHVLDGSIIAENAPIIAQIGKFEVNDGNLLVDNFANRIDRLSVASAQNASIFSQRSILLDNVQVDETLFVHSATGDISNFVNAPVNAKPVRANSAGLDAPNGYVHLVGSDFNTVSVSSGNSNRFTHTPLEFSDNERFGVVIVNRRSLEIAQFTNPFDEVQVSGVSSDTGSVFVRTTDGNLKVESIVESGDGTIAFVAHNKLALESDLFARNKFIPKDEIRTRLFVLDELPASVAGGGIVQTVNIRAASTFDSLALQIHWGDGVIDRLDIDSNQTVQASHQYGLQFVGNTLSARITVSGQLSDGVFFENFRSLGNRGDLTAARLELTAGAPISIPVFVQTLKRPEFDALPDIQVEQAAAPFSNPIQTTQIEIPDSKIDSGGERLESVIIVDGKVVMRKVWNNFNATQTDEIVEQIIQDGTYVPGYYEIRRVSTDGFTETLEEFEKQLERENLSSTEEFSGDADQPLQIEIIRDSEGEAKDGSAEQLESGNMAKSSMGLLAGAILADRLKRTITSRRNQERDSTGQPLGVTHYLESSETNYFSRSARRQRRLQRRPK